METAKVPLFKLFVYSVVDVKDEFEEVMGLKNAILSCDGLVIFIGSHFFDVFEVLTLILTQSIACPHSWRLFCYWRRQYLNEFFFSIN